jgi:hypothetical protein
MNGNVGRDAHLGDEIEVLLVTESVLVLHSIEDEMLAL